MDPNANEVAALSVFFSDAVFPNANVVACADGTSSFLLAAPNAKDVDGVALFSVADEPNENPAPTLAFFFPPSCLSFSSSPPRPRFGFGSLEVAPNLNAPVLAVSPLFSSAPDEAELWPKLNVAFVFDDDVVDDVEAPKLNPILPFDVSSFLSSFAPTLLSVVDDGVVDVPPKLKPPADGFALAGVALPKENPEPALVLVSSFCSSFFDRVTPNLIAGVAAEELEELAPPNENPPAPMLPADDAAAGAGAAVDAGAPNLNPPVPILAFLSLRLLPLPGAASDLLAVPSLGASQDKQLVSSSGFCEVHALHFHCFFWLANILPHPSVEAVVVVSLVSVATGATAFAGDLEIAGEEDWGMSVFLP